MSVQIRRDPSARIVLMRAGRAEFYKLAQRHMGPFCLTCGGPSRFSYRWVSDDGKRPRAYTNAFCGVACFDAYSPSRPDAGERGELLAGIAGDIDNLAAVLDDRLPAQAARLIRVSQQLREIAVTVYAEEGQ